MYKPKNIVSWDYQEPKEISEERKLELLTKIWGIIGIKETPTIEDYYNKKILTTRLSMKFAENHYRSIFEKPQ